MRLRRYRGQEDEDHQQKSRIDAQVPVGHDQSRPQAITHLSQHLLGTDTGSDQGQANRSPRQRSLSDEEASCGRCCFLRRPDAQNQDDDAIGEDNRIIDGDEHVVDLTPARAKDDTMRPISIQGGLELPESHASLCRWAVEGLLYSTPLSRLPQCAGGVE